MTSIASWQAAHPALNTSIFRLAAIFLVPSISALPRLNGRRWQRNGTRYPLEVPPGSSVELRGLKRETECDRPRRPRDAHRLCPHFRNSWRLHACQGHEPLPVILGIPPWGSEVRGE